MDVGRSKPLFASYARVPERMEATMRMWGLIFGLILTTQAHAIADLSSLPPIGVWKTASTEADTPFILSRTGEPFLMFQPAVLAGAVLVFFPRERAVVVNSIVRQIAVSPGVEQTEVRHSKLRDIEDLMLPRNLPDPVVELIRADNERGEAKLFSRGIGRGEFQESRIVSKPFNTLGTREASSNLVIHIVDAHEFLGARGCIVIAYRWDKAKEWGLSEFHNPLSFGYHLVQKRVVTAGLMEVIGRGARDLGSKYLELPLGQKAMYEYLEKFEEGKKWLSISH